MSLKAVTASTDGVNVAFFVLADAAHASANQLTMALVALTSSAAIPTLVQALQDSGLTVLTAVGVFTQPQTTIATLPAPPPPALLVTVPSMAAGSASTSAGTISTDDLTWIVIGVVGFIVLILGTARLMARKAAARSA